MTECVYLTHTKKYIEIFIEGSLERVSLFGGLGFDRHLLFYGSLDLRSTVWTQKTTARSNCSIAPCLIDFIGLFLPSFHPSIYL